MIVEYALLYSYYDAKTEPSLITQHDEDVLNTEVTQSRITSPVPLRIKLTDDLGNVICLSQIRMHNGVATDFAVW